MKKGFTLIELMIVIIIIGILATVGIVQYQAAVEKSRGSEAKSVLGFLRDSCGAIWMESNDTASCNTTTLNLGTGATTIPNDCRTSHWFSYSVATGTSNLATFNATRCTGTAGKKPGASSAHILSLTANYSAGEGSFTTQAVY